MRQVWAVLVLLYGVPAAAQTARAPRSVADCEVIRNDLAYNACLASFGPKAGEASVRGGAGYDDAPSTVGATPAGTTAGRRGGANAGSGRQAASFDVISGRSRGSRAAPRVPPSISFGNPRAPRR